MSVSRNVTRDPGSLLFVIPPSHREYGLVHVLIVEVRTAEFVPVNDALVAEGVQGYVIEAPQ